MIVAGVDPANPRTPFPLTATSRNKLVLRILSSLVMVPLALGAAYFGDLVFVVFWAIAALGILWEWDTLVCTHDKNTVFTIGSVSIVGVTLLWALDRPVPALIFVGLGMLGVATLAARIHRAWCVAGMAYAAVTLIAPLILRRDPALGFLAMVFVFAVVWSTDIGAYIAGRALGGPKLLRRISPNKTWIGAVGGLAAAIGGGALAAKFGGIDNIAALCALAFVLSVVSQGGDLLESAIKRQFNAKDSSWLIPGHGGLMDRLDGFVAAAIAAAIIGLARGGVEAPGRGLLIW